MLEFISGVAEAVLSGQEGLTIGFKVEGDQLISVLPVLNIQHTTPIRKATRRDQGLAVGENLLAAWRDA